MTRWLRWSVSGYLNNKEIYFSHLCISNITMLCTYFPVCKLAFSVAAGSWEEVEDYFTIFNAYGACVWKVSSFMPEGSSVKGWCLEKKISKAAQLILHKFFYLGFSFQKINQVSTIRLLK